MFRPRSAKYTEVRIRNRMPKGFIVKNVFVEITALVSVAISLILLKVLLRFVEHLIRIEWFLPQVDSPKHVRVIVQHAECYVRAT